MKLVVGFILFEEVTAKYLADFLPSLKQALGFLPITEYQIEVVDNSRITEGENARILTEFEDQAFPIKLDKWRLNYERLGENIGFSRAYNLMIRRAVAVGAEYFLVINPDTQLNNSSISRLISVLDNNGDFGSVAPKILRWDYSNRQTTNIIDSLGIVLGRGLSFYDLHQGLADKIKGEGLSILGPSGAAGLYRRRALQAVAIRNGTTGQEEFFDENFFMYKEDCDLAYRLFLAGYRSALVPGAVIYHDRTATSSSRRWVAVFKDRQSKSRSVKVWSLRNQLYIYQKYWLQQNLFNKLAILGRIFVYFIYSLILEQYLLIEFWKARSIRSRLTNIK